MEKMGGAGLQECHRRSPISRKKNECDMSPFDHQYNEGSLHGNSKSCIKCRFFLLFCTLGTFKVIVPLQCVEANDLDLTEC